MPGPTPAEYSRSVFINCPFDRQYARLFHAIVFAVQDCGFIARCALEVDDASQARISKILRIIAGCRVGIHDISRTEPDPRYRLPRFNMPLELGMFLGAKEYGTGRQKDKICLVLDRDRFRFQKFCSDIAGQDIAAHAGKVDAAILAVRNFLRGVRPEVQLPGPVIIHQRYLAFSQELPALCRQSGLRKPDLTFHDYVALLSEWLKVQP